ncbi:MAG: hypothetical protein GX815_04260 [Clostridiales bacterium]|jgi:hypothetical protein|nr:hypothetical protein [Clostridiales bacterium]
MSTIMLIMRRRAIVQGLMNRLRNSPDIRLVYEPDYDNARDTIRSCDANVALIEVTESGHYDIEYCLTLCKSLQTDIPGCKLLLMCPEQDEYSVKLVVDAKGKKQIDDFVFYDVTVDYLAEKLISI